MDWIAGATEGPGLENQMDKRQLLDNARHIHKLSGDTIERLEAELAEAEKPELRHGDYGPKEGTEGRLVLKQYQKETLFSAGSASCARHCSSNQMPDAVLGNIFDDLKAIAEELTKHTWDFGHNSYDAYIDMHGDLLLNGVSIQLIVRKEEIPAFILNLQRLQYTERKKNDS